MTGITETLLMVALVMFIVERLFVWFVAVVAA